MDGKRLRHRTAAAVLDVPLLPTKHRAHPLPGFEAPWERALFQGRELSLDAPLAEQGVSGPGVVVTTVRRVLVAEGWKVGGRVGVSYSWLVVFPGAGTQPPVARGLPAIS